MSEKMSELFSRFREELPRLEQSIDELKAELSRYTGVVLYGAGSSGIALLLALRRAGIFPVCFADGAPEKWGSVCMGLPVMPPQELTDKFGSDILVVVCINTDGHIYCRSFAQALRQGGHSGVHKKLRECGCQHVIDYIALRRCFALFRGDNTGNLPSCPDVFSILEHQEEIEKVCDRLGDGLSRETYQNLLAFRLFGEGDEVATLPQNEQYFPNLLQLSRQEAFVDCGAFDGLTLRNVLERTGGELEAYYALEPDPVNLQKLKEYTAGLSEPLRKKILLSDCAAWRDEGRISLYALNGPGSFAAEYGPVSVPAITIDRLLDGRQATAIKMNIEGSELAALEGAKETVRSWHPKLMIAGYHKTWDFWEVPEYILAEGYTLYLRSYMHHLSFVFYGC